MSKMHPVMKSSLIAVGSIFVLLALLVYHGYETLTEGMPKSAGSWFYVVLLLSDAAIVVKEVRHLAGKLSDLEAQEQMAIALMWTGWVGGLVLSFVIQATHTGDSEAGFFLGMIIFVIGVVWYYNVQLRKKDRQNPPTSLPPGPEPA